MPIDWGILARAVHVVAVVVWIGGVSLVTTVLLPALAQQRPDDWLSELDAIERRFAPQARVAVLLVLLSGLYMLYRYDMWGRFADAEFWWMHLMVGVWLIFAALLFVVEPVILQRAVRLRSAIAPQAMMGRLLRFHRVMLGLSLVAVFAAVAGSGGLF
jgi:uncharacterized membrane protein